MKLKLAICIPLFVGAAAISSCRKDNGANTPRPPSPAVDTSGPLKNAAAFPIGIAIEYGLFKNNASYKNIVLREADQVTFGYQMKHGAIVKDDGSFDYSLSDELYNVVTAAGLGVFGHTLVWHSNQNGNYLRSLTVSNGGTSGNNLLPAGDFESGTGTSGTGTSLFTGWNLLVGGSDIGSFASTAGNGSARALLATVTTPGTNAYDIQAIGPNWSATIGTQYNVSFDVKASVAAGRLRIVNQNFQYQQYEVSPTTSWASYSWTLTAAETSPILRFNFPAAGVYAVDNVRITEVTPGGALPNAQAAANIDSAMSRFIRTSMMRYAGKVKAWDVVNEPMSDGTGAVRTNSGSTAGDIFYWSQYLGRDYALKAFNYAKSADPGALLFINDYNLESDARKLDSLLAYINELRSKGAKIDGIGTQMHMSIATSRSAIDNMFAKLAATGLKIRVSELDIRMNPNNNPGFVPSAQDLNDQAAMYEYVIGSFKRNVPPAQQYDVTIWGVADSDSWIVTVLHKEDFPLLFNSSYEKKPAYPALAKALRAQ